jgi:hypothetical protein
MSMSKKSAAVARKTIVRSSVSGRYVTAYVADKSKPVRHPMTSVTTKAIRDSAGLSVRDTRAVRGVLDKLGIVSKRKK